MPIGLRVRELDLELTLNLNRRGAGTGMHGKSGQLGAKLSF
jgi:hypothetical protein